MKKWIERIFELILVIALIICAVIVGKWYFEMKTEEHVTDEIQNTVESQSNEDYFSRDAWNALYAQNPDLVGYIHTENNDINLPIVQSKEEDMYYLRRNFNKKYSSMGTPFVFSDANPETDANTTVYGHNVMYMKTAMFSPLVKLAEQENFEKSRTFTIWWKDVKNTYEIADIYVFDETDSNEYAYSARNFYTETEFNEWISYAESRNMIQTETKAQYGDQLATLMTCYDFGGTRRLIIVGKLISSVSY